MKYFAIFIVVLSGFFLSYPYIAERLTNNHKSYTEAVKKAENYAKNGNIEQSVHEYIEAEKHLFALVNEGNIDYDSWLGGLVEKISNSKLPPNEQIFFLKRAFEYIEHPKCSNRIICVRLKDETMNALVDLDVTIDDKLEFLENEVLTKGKYGHTKTSILLSVIDKLNLSNEEKISLFRKIYDNVQIELDKIKRKPDGHISNENGNYFLIVARWLSYASYLDPSLRLNLSFDLIKLSSSLEEYPVFTGEALIYSFLNGDFTKLEKQEFYDLAFDLINEKDDGPTRTRNDLLTRYFNDHYYKLKSIRYPPKKEFSLTSEIKGKVLPIMLNTVKNIYEFDRHFTYKLPNELIAKKPSEINYIILNEYTRTVIGSYHSVSEEGSKGTAFRTNIMLKLININDITKAIFSNIYYGKENPKNQIIVRKGHQMNTGGGPPVEDAVSDLIKIFNIQK